MRWTIRLLSVVLFFLFIWLLGFIIGDIDDLQRPHHQVFYDTGINAELTQSRDKHNSDLEQIRRETARHQGIKKSSSENVGYAKDRSKQYWTLLEADKDAGRPEDSEKLENYEKANRDIDSAQAAQVKATGKLTELEEQENTINKALAALEKQIKPQREEADALYQEALRDHNHTLAIYKLSFIIPVFLLAAWALAKKRESIYRPIMKALILASFLHVGGVMFEHFDAEYFKYIALTAAVLIVLAFLVRLLQSSARPRPDLLLKQRREAYDRSNCPECAYPFPGDHGDAFTCPACGAGLFASCDSCGNSRHNLLPFCIHCGSEEAAPAVSV